MRKDNSITWADWVILRIDSINEFLGKGVSWLTALLVLMTMADVVSRYFFQRSQVWILELEWHLFALIFLLGAGYALKHGRHVRVDLFYQHYSRRNKAWLDFFGTLLLLIPWCVLIIWAAWPYALASFQIGEGSPDPGGLPARYLIKFAVVLGMVFLALQGVAELLRAATVLFSKQSGEQI